MAMEYIIPKRYKDRYKGMRSFICLAHSATCSEDVPAGYRRGAVLAACILPHPREMEEQVEATPGGGKLFVAVAYIGIPEGVSIPENLDVDPGSHCDPRRTWTGVDDAPDGIIAWSKKHSQWLPLDVVATDDLFISRGGDAPTEEDKANLQRLMRMDRRRLRMERSSLR